MSELGDRVRLAREAKQPKMSQAQLGAPTDYTQTSISELELGMSVPRPRGLKALAIALDLPLDELTSMARIAKASLSRGGTTLRWYVRSQGVIVLQQYVRHEWLDVPTVEAP